MSVGRQFNWKGQQRVDVAHMRAVESSIAFDFDTLAGQALGGGKPYILSGFKMAAWTVGQAPETLQLITSGSVVFHYTASENGSMLFVPVGRAPETLSVSNARVTGGFTAGQPNYVGIDYTRLEDDSTADIVQFLDATTLVATPKTIPLGRTLDYQIFISTTPPSGQANICPVAKVFVDGNGDVTSVEDIRTMYFRLAKGGDAPDPLYPFAWTQGRGPEDVESFEGGDKVIGNEKEWKSAIMQRLWEVTGGEHWYSDVTDRNMKFYATTPGSITWVNPTLTWADLRISLDNSTATINTITNGNHAIVDGEVGYVEVDRYTNATLTVQWALTPAIYNALAAPIRPGSRYILFWRKGSLVYSRLDYTPVGLYSGTATTATYGIVKTNTDEGASSGSFAVVAIGLLGQAVASGLTRGTSVAMGAGLLSIGTGANDSGVVIGKPSANFNVDGAAADNFAVGSVGTKTSGNVAVFKNAAATVAKIPFDGVVQVGEDILLRSYIGWGQTFFTNVTTTGSAYYPFADLTSGGATSADNITISIVE